MPSAPASELQVLLEDQLCLFWLIAWAAQATCICFTDMYESKNQHCVERRKDVHNLGTESPRVTPRD